MERLWLALPRLPSGVLLGERPPSAPLPATAVDHSKPPALVLGGGTAQARLLTLCRELSLAVERVFPGCQHSTVWSKTCCCGYALSDASRLQRSSTHLCSMVPRIAFQAL